MKKVSLLVLSFALVMSVAIAGCSNDRASSDGGKEDSEKEIELTWWVDAREDVQSIYEEIKEGFEEQNPNITINMVVTPDDNVHEKISIAANTDELPDVQQGSFFWPLSYVSSDLLVPLDELIDEDDIDEGILNSVSVDDETFIYPNSTVAIGLLVNKDLFEEKGALDLLPKNMEPWTFDQFMEAAKAVTDPESQTYGYGLFAGDTGGDQAHHAMLWGFGAQTWSDDNQEAILNSAEGVEGLQFFVDMVDEGVVPPGAATNRATNLLNDMFIQGNLGMIFGNVGHVAAVNEAFTSGAAEEFEIDLVPFPTKDGEDTNTVLFGYGTWIWETGNSVKIEQAKKFVQFLNSKENMAKLAEAPSVITPRSSLAGHYEEGTLQHKTTQLFQYAGNIGLAVPGYTETRNAFYPEIQAALNKDKSPQQALDDFVEKANEIIEQSQ